MPRKPSRETLSDQIAQLLLEVISEQELKPGASLPSEQKLAEDYGVSRPVVREALKALVGRGVVEKINGKGAVIKSLDDGPIRLFFQRAVQIEKDAILQLMEVRRPLEAQSAKLAAQRRTAKDLAAMEDTVAAMRKHLHDVETYVQLDVELHLQIARATQNEMMHFLTRSIRESLRSASREGLKRLHVVDEQLEHVQRLHEDIISEIKDGDPEGARRAMIAHFDKARVNLLGKVDHQEKKPL